MGKWRQARGTLGKETHSHDVHLVRDVRRRARRLSDRRNARVFNIPEAGLVLIMGIDQFLNMGRSATNPCRYPRARRHLRPLVPKPPA
ncbi:MAG: hypothetical protein E6H71_09190, partial [Betaproteobacteria bacterium]